MLSALVENVPIGDYELALGKADCVLSGMHGVNELGRDGAG